MNLKINSKDKQIKYKVWGNRGDRVVLGVMIMVNEPVFRHTHTHTPMYIRGKLRFSILHKDTLTHAQEDGIRPLPSD